MCEREDNRIGCLFAWFALRSVHWLLDAGLPVRRGGPPPSTKMISYPNPWDGNTYIYYMLQCVSRITLFDQLWTHGSIQYLNIGAAQIDLSPSVRFICICMYICICIRIYAHVGTYQQTTNIPFCTCTLPAACFFLCKVVVLQFTFIPNTAVVSSPVKASVKNSSNHSASICQPTDPNSQKGEDKIKLTHRS